MPGEGHHIAHTDLLGLPIATIEETPFEKALAIEQNEKRMTSPLDLIFWRP
jgi:hypothetical protein